MQHSSGFIRLALGIYMALSTQLSYGHTPEQCSRYYAFQNWELAREHCLACADSQTDNPKVYYILADMEHKNLLEESHPSAYVHYLEKAATLGEPNAQYDYGKILYSGVGVEKNQKEGIAWLEKAATQGHIRAQSYLGHIYQYNSFYKDPQKAVYWLTKASEQNNPRAQFELAELIRQGKAMEQDYSLATKLYEASAIQGHPQAQAALALAYHQGLGVTRNAEFAAKWYLKAAAGGIVLAQYNVAQLYYKGHGLSQSKIKAYAWMNQAAGQGLPEAVAAQKKWAKELTPSERTQAERLSHELVNTKLS